jgi:uncharacterized protein YceK
MNNKSLFALILVVVLIIPGCAQVTSKPDSSSGGKATAMPALKSGDQTPEGLMDAPRTFLYQVRLDSGEEINVTYTSYPPTPAGEKSAITLTFFEGVINPGNYLIANGTYDSKSKTLTVVKEGDSIETFAKKP